MIRKKILLVLVSLVVLGFALPCLGDTVTYEYDNLYRLIKATYSDGTVIEYTYDQAGNRLSVVRTPPASAPTVQISADPVSITEGQSSTLTWTSTDADTCEIDQGIGTVDPNDSTTVSPTETTTYTITATGDGGTATDNVTVTVTTPSPQTLTLRPNAAGDHTGITYMQPSYGFHYDKVDEGSADDFTTAVSTFSYDVIVEEYDLYGIPDHTTESGTINYVRLRYRVMMMGTGTGSCKPAIKTGGTVYYGTEKTPASSWTTYTYTWTTNPKTGAAWTWNDIDALQIGIAMSSYGEWVSCTQVFIKVNYTPSGGQ